MAHDASRFRSTFAGLTAACCLAGAGAVRGDDPMIDLTVVGSGSTFKIEFRNSACTDRPGELGCIEAVHGSSPMLMWEIDSASEQYWMLTRLQFSVDGEHWGDPAFPLADCTMKAFALEDRDRYTGNASSAMITGNGRKLQVRDRNEEPCQTHYRIYAMPRAGGIEINSDPMIDNKGGGTP